MQADESRCCWCLLLDRTYNCVDVLWKCFPWQHYQKRITVARTLQVCYHVSYLPVDSSSMVQFDLGQKKSTSPFRREAQKVCGFCSSVLSSEYIKWTSDKWNGSMVSVLRRTFSLVSTHLLIATREDPVRSFISRMAFLTMTMVDIFGVVMEIFSFSVFMRVVGTEIKSVFCAQEWIVKLKSDCIPDLAPEIFWVWKSFQKSKTSSVWCSTVNT